MPGKPPYFPFYPNDFAADGNVEAMTTEQVGAYTLLLCKAWNQEPPGTIPDDDAILARWARVTPEQWAGMRAGILAAFTLGGDRRWHQKRLEHEYEKLLSVLKGKAKGGKKGARARWRESSDGLPINTPNDIPINTPTGSPIGSHNGTPTLRAFDSDSISSSGKKTKKKRHPGVGGVGGGGGGAYPADFERFWMAYPLRVAKGKAWESWQKISPDAALVEKIVAAVEAQKSSPQWRKNGGEFIPHASTWLNQRRWDDELFPDVAHPSASTGDGYAALERELKQSLPPPVTLEELAARDPYYRACLPDPPGDEP